MIYFDASYLAKCYLNEAGSVAVRRLAAIDPLLSDGGDQGRIRKLR